MEAKAVQPIARFKKETDKDTDDSNKIVKKKPGRPPKKPIETPLIGNGKPWKYFRF